jgi:hypothetical protein
MSNSESQELDKVHLLRTGATMQEHKQEIIESIELLLNEAKAGRVQGLAYVGISAQQDFLLDIKGSIGTLTLIGGVEVLKSRILAIQEENK